jgi:hypothetical protein
VVIFRLRTGWRPPSPHQRADAKFRRRGADGRIRRRTIAGRRCRSPSPLYAADPLQVPQQDRTLNRGAQGLPTSQSGPPPSMNSGGCGHVQARRCHAALHRDGGMPGKETALCREAVRGRPHQKLSLMPRHSCRGVRAVRSLETLSSRVRGESRSPLPSPPRGELGRGV